MTVRNDKGLQALIRENGYACIDGNFLKSKDSLIEYIDEHYAPKPDVTKMTCVSVLKDALTAIRRYEDWNSKEYHCLQDVEAIIRLALKDLGGNDV